MLRIQDTSTPVVVLRSDSHGGLNVIRSLGRLGIPVYNVDPNPWAPAFHSRYCRDKFLWDLEHRPSEDSLVYMFKVRQMIGKPCILIPTTDRTAEFVADHAQALAEGFIFPKLSPKLVHSLASKREMFYLAREHNIPTPDALFPHSRDDVLRFLKRARFPIMLKGIDGQRLWDRIGKKMFISGSEDELLGIYDAAEDPENPNLMLQEYIPGGDDTVWMFNGYFNEQSQCLAGFTGRKLRQCPVHTGSTSLGICLYNEAIEENTKRFMKAVGYRGTLDIGYRYDARDGDYKVLDVNPRIGASFRLFVGENGMDVVRALYLDLTGQEVVSSPARDGRKWIVEDLDLVSCYRYHREGALSLAEWVGSFRGIDEAAFISAVDPLPSFAMAVLRACELMRRIVRLGREIFRGRGRSANRVANGTPKPRLPIRMSLGDSATRKSGQ